MMQPEPPCPGPTYWWQTWESGLLLLWQLLLGVYSVVVFCCCFFPPPNYVAFWDSQTPYRPTCESISYCVETSPLSWLPPQDGSPSLNLLSPFLSFIFCPTSSWREWTAFWVHGVLCQCSKVVLWKLLNIQMILWWICGGKNWPPYPTPLPS